MPDRTALAAIALLPLAAVVSLASCRADPRAGGSPYADGGPLDAPDFVDAGCTVEIDTPALEAPTHVPIGTDITWDSNPPSSGEHYPIWAAYQAYTSPVPRGYYVHDEEHGGVILLYNCPDDAGCPDVAAALQSVSDSLPDDSLCTSTGQGVRVRTVITPDPLLD
ncbi:MAG TPA: DUF3105 domain-containing protein, partial [Polyangiaceae bacterium]